MSAPELTYEPMEAQRLLQLVKEKHFEQGKAFRLQWVQENGR